MQEVPYCTGHYCFFQSFLSKNNNKAVVAAALKKNVVTNVRNICLCTDLYFSWYLVLLDFCSEIWSLCNGFTYTLYNLDMTLLAL